MSNLVPTTSALDRLQRTTKRSSLDDLVSAKTKRTILMCDVSSSMGIPCKDGKRRIDKLAGVVDRLRTTHPVPMAAFGLTRSYGMGGSVALVERLPEPQGLTPLDEAIDYGRMQEANHLIVVTDGIPDSQDDAFAAAARFGHPIDVFFIGDKGDAGARFCVELAKRTGGTCDVTDLGEPKQLEAKIIALIGDGSL
jgi:hypothetical protein